MIVVVLGFSALPRVKTPRDFIDRPIAAALFGMIILVIVRQVRILIREHRSAATDPDDHDMHDTQQR